MSGYQQTDLVTESAKIDSADYRTAVHHLRYCQVQHQYMQNGLGGHVNHGLTSRHCGRLD